MAAVDGEGAGEGADQGAGEGAGPAIRILRTLLGLHALMLQNNKIIGGIIALLEDGGELIAMTLAMLGGLAGYLRYDTAPMASDDTLRWSYQLASLRDTGMAR